MFRVESYSLAALASLGGSGRRSSLASLASRGAGGRKGGSFFVAWAGVLDVGSLLGGEACQKIRISDDFADFGGLDGGKSEFPTIPPRQHRLSRLGDHIRAGQEPVVFQPKKPEPENRRIFGIFAT